MTTTIPATAPSRDDVTGWLTRIDPFTAVVAAEVTPAHLDPADIRQEARIAAWRALAKQPVSPREYLVATVKQRARSAAARQDWTGQPSQQGKPSVDPLRRRDTDSVDRITATAGVDVFGAAADTLAAVEDAYHHGQVHAALADLPEQARAYCVLRFWGGMSEAQIAAQIGVNKRRVNDLWNRDTRPRLAERLAGLRGRHHV